MRSFTDTDWYTDMGKSVATVLWAVNRKQIQSADIRIRHSANQIGNCKKVIFMISSTPASWSVEQRNISTVQTAKQSLNH